MEMRGMGSSQQQCVCLAGTCVARDLQRDLHCAIANASVEMYFNATLIMRCLEILPEVGLRRIRCPDLALRRGEEEKRIQREGCSYKW